MPERAFAVTPEIPFTVLTRVVGEHGVIKICREALVVVPADKASARWIIITLDMLGFPTRPI